MKEKIQRYQTLKNYRGIRKDVLNNTFIATKSIKGKRYYESFKTIKEAVHWKNTFNPFEANSFEEEKIQNGPNLKKVWALYTDFYFSSLEKSTIDTKNERWKFFYDMEDLGIYDLTPGFLDQYIQKKKELASINNSPRQNLRHPLSELKALINWYKENFDYKLINPVLKRHYQLGVFKKGPVRGKKMSPDEVLKFFSKVEGIYKDVSMVQFYLAARIGEIAGIQFSSIDFEERSILIKDVVVWDRCKRFVELKPYTKNGDVRYAHINDTLFEIFERRFKNKSPDSNYVFHIEGALLSYRSIQHYYNKALRKVGLYGKYSSTHIMRHSMATITRRVTGSLESTQAITGHKDQKLVQHYADLPSHIQIDAQIAVEAFLIKRGLGISCEQTRANLK